jgi:hypothetical protein
MKTKKKQYRGEVWLIGYALLIAVVVFCIGFVFTNGYGLLPVFCAEHPVLNNTTLCENEQLGSLSNSISFPINFSYEGHAYQLDFNSTMQCAYYTGVNYAGVRVAIPAYLFPNDILPTLKGGVSPATETKGN